MPRLRIGKKPTPLGVALTVWELWRRLPPAQRKRLLVQARKHGPKLVAGAVKAGRAARKAR